MLCHRSHPLREAKRHIGRGLGALLSLIVFGFVLGSWFWLEVGIAAKAPKHPAAISAAKDETKGKHESGGADDRIAAYTGWLALFTAFLALTAGFEIHLLVLAARTADETVKATNKLATAAAGQREIIRDQLRLQRAYVFAGMGKFNMARDVHQRLLFQIRPDYFNRGQTPAWVRHIIYVVCPDPPPANPDYNAGKTLIISDPTPNDNIQRFTAGTHVNIEMTNPIMIFYGRVHYIDMMGEPRFSGFIYRLHQNGGHDRVADANPEYLRWD